MNQEEFVYGILIHMLVVIFSMFYGKMYDKGYYEKCLEEGGFLSAPIFFFLGAPALYLVLAPRHAILFILRKAREKRDTISNATGW